MSVDWQFGKWLDALYNGEKKGETLVAPYPFDGLKSWVNIGMQDNSDAVAVITMPPDDAEELGMRIIAAARQARGEFV